MNLKLNEESFFKNEIIEDENLQVQTTYTFPRVPFSTM